MRSLVTCAGGLAFGAALIVLSLWEADVEAHATREEKDVMIVECTVIHSGFSVSTKATLSEEPYLAWVDAPKLFFLKGKRHPCDEPRRMQHVVLRTTRSPFTPLPSIVAVKGAWSEPEWAAEQDTRLPLFVISFGVLVILLSVVALVRTWRYR